MTKAYDYTGQIFGRLTAVSYTGKHTNGKNKKRIWLFQCECGKQCEKPIEKAVRGWTKSCGCLISTRSSLEQLQHSVFSGYYQDGGLTEDEFKTLSRRPCWVCGGLVSETGSVRTHRTKRDVSWKYHGLDRIDNNLPHSRNNVLPCCWDCNEWRKDRTIPQFIEKIQAAYNNLVKL